MPAWIHTGSEVTFRRLLRVGDDIDVRAVPLEKWERKGHHFVELYIAYVVRVPSRRRSCIRRSFAWHGHENRRVAFMRSPVMIGPIACAATLCVQGMAAEPPGGPASRSVEPATPATERDDLVEVWVVLSEPALATLPVDATNERAALQQRIVRQQDRVMSRLVELGAIESGRIQQVSNAIAVRLPHGAIDSIKTIEGVTSVYPVSSRNRVHP
jgi:hypothetical protein